MKKFVFVLFSLFSVSAFSQSEWVNPFVGTDGTGHTFPGATLPFGMVQAGPDTRIDGSWEGCSGYHYSDSVIYGFSQTHLSGTGCSDYGDIMLMPVLGKLENSSYSKFYASSFSHESEKASPGYYAVTLNRGKLRCEVSVSHRGAFYQFTSPVNDTLHLIFDFSHRDELLGSSFKMQESTAFSGFRKSKAWAKEQDVFFYAETNKSLPKPVLTAGENGTQLLRFSFPVKAGEQVQVKIGISGVDENGAEQNLKTEIPHFDFGKLRDEARKIWDKELSVIEVKGASEKEQMNFYTALYHTMIHPNVYSDVDGRYLGRDRIIHQGKGNYYTVFSLWDTFRALHPLHTLINRKRTADFIQTFLLQFKQGGRLPMWELWCNETDCMIGYHAVAVMADAHAKGIPMDIQLALEAAVSNATYKERGVPEYIKRGYLEIGDESESVAKTLEYAYDDWCIAVLAKAAGKPELEKAFLERAGSWIHLLDPETGLMRPRINGGWMNPFEPREVNNHYTEANAWQYSFFVPHDVPGLISSVGGGKRFEKLLDDLFSLPPATTGRIQPDITGLIGQYAHGNEPSHHMAYLYNYIGKPEKTASLVHRILDSLYFPTADGLPGNEDCGQMSAWYVFSALGFYPLTPGSDHYAIGFPIFEESSIKLENGKVFTVKAKGNNKGNYHLQSLHLNGKPLSRLWITHAEIMNGGELSFVFGNEASNSMIFEPFPKLIGSPVPVPAPAIKAPSAPFKEQIFVEVVPYHSGLTVWYTTDNSDPVTNGKVYAGSVPVNSKVRFRAVCRDAAGNVSRETQADFIPFPHPERSVILKSVYNPQYNAGGADGLIDGIRGPIDWRKGNWQGYQATDFEAVLDLGSSQSIKRVEIGFLQDLRSWILMPKAVRIEIYDEQMKLLKSLRQPVKVDDVNEGSFIEDIRFSLDEKSARYVKVFAENYGNLPPGHPGAGNPAFIFTDEIIVE